MLLRILKESIFTKAFESADVDVHTIVEAWLDVFYRLKEYYNLNDFKRDEIKKLIIEMVRLLIAESGEENCVRIAKECHIGVGIKLTIEEGDSKPGVSSGRYYLYKDYVFKLECEGGHVFKLECEGGHVIRHKARSASYTEDSALVARDLIGVESISDIGESLE